MLAIWQHVGQFLAIFSLRMSRIRYLWVSGEHFDTGIRFFYPDLLMGNDSSAIWRRSMLIFAFDMLNVHHTSTSGLFDLLTYKKYKVCHVFLPSVTMKISTTFEVDTIIRCLIIAFLLLIHYVTLRPWPLTFWPWSVSTEATESVWKAFENYVTVWLLFFFTVLLCCI